MAAPFKGPDVPHRTSRKVALEKSDPRHFTGGAEGYCTSCGHPDSGPGVPTSHKHYEDKALEANASEANSQPHGNQKSPLKGV